MRNYSAKNNADAKELKFLDFSHGYLCRSVTNSSDGRREIAFANFSAPRRLRSGMGIGMQDEFVISVKDVRKRFKVYIDKGESLKEKLLFFKRNRYENRLVLDGISFQIRRGEAVGLIGKNGCGKSTTLKLLTRIMYPTSGQVKIKGRVSSLIELGAGFHPDMSGRENIYTNASIFGLTKKQIDERLEDIIEFSELEEFIDNPVRTYSSGMYMRLAFSVAINVEADILLIDEILAVGDVSFQKKCFEKLKQIKRAGTTIVIVSHSLDQIEEICDRSIWIEDGKIRMEGIPKEVHEKYLKKMESKRMERIHAEYVDSQEQQSDNSQEQLHYFNGRKVLRLGKGQMYYQDVEVTDAEGNPKIVFHTGEELQANFKYINHSDYKNAIFCARIYNSDDTLCFGTNTNIEKGKMMPVQKEGTLSIAFHHLPLLNGQYILDVDIVDETGEAQDVIHEAVDFYIEGENARNGVAMIQTTWKVDKRE